VERQIISLAVLRNISRTFDEVLVYHSLGVRKETRASWRLDLPGGTLPRQRVGGDGQECRRTRSNEFRMPRSSNRRA
jgi:hypothetical protein